MSEANWGRRPRSFEQLDAEERDKIEQANAALDPVASAAHILNQQRLQNVRDAVADEFAARPALAAAERGWRPFSSSEPDAKPMRGDAQQALLQRQLEEARADLVSLALEEGWDRAVFANPRLDLDGTAQSPASQRSSGALHGIPFQNWATDPQLTTILTPRNYAREHLQGFYTDAKRGTAAELYEQATEMMLGDFSEPSLQEINALRQEGGQEPLRLITAPPPEDEAKKKEWESSVPEKIKRLNEVFGDIRRGTEDQMRAHHERLGRSVEANRPSALRVHDSMRTLREQAANAGDHTLADFLAKHEEQLLASADKPHPDRDAVERRIDTETALFHYQSDSVRHSALTQLFEKWGKQYGIELTPPSAPSLPMVLVEPLINTLKSAAHPGNDAQAFRPAMSLDTGRRLADAVSRMEAAETSLGTFLDERNQAAVALTDALAETQARAERTARLAERLPGTPEERDQVVASLRREHLRRNLPPSHAASVAHPAEVSAQSVELSIEAPRIQTAPVSPAEAPLAKASTTSTQDAFVNDLALDPTPAAVPTESVGARAVESAPAQSETMAPALAADEPRAAMPWALSALDRASAQKSPEAAEREEQVSGPAPEQSAPSPVYTFVEHPDLAQQIGGPRGFADRLQGVSPASPATMPEPRAMQETRESAAQAAHATRAALPWMPALGNLDRAVLDVARAQSRHAMQGQTVESAHVLLDVASTQSMQPVHASALAEQSAPTATNHPVETATPTTEPAAMSHPNSPNATNDVNTPSASAQDLNPQQAATMASPLERMALHANDAASATDANPAHELGSLSGFAARQRDRHAQTDVVAQGEGEGRGEGKHRGASAAAAPGMHTHSAQSESEEASQAPFSKEAAYTKWTSVDATAEEREMEQFGRANEGAMRENTQGSAERWAAARSARPAAASDAEHPIVQQMHDAHPHAEEIKKGMQVPDPASNPSILAGLSAARGLADRLAARRAPSMEQVETPRPARGPRV